MPGRNNGLEAAAYAPLADLDPQLADAMLDALREAGVAAYTVPAPGQAGVYFEMRSPDRPTDRLWVDRDARAQAEQVLTDRLPQLRAELEAHHRSTDDDAWAAIVAAYESAPADPLPRWPASEDVPPEPEDDSTSQPPTPAAAAEPAAAARPSRRADDEHYVPPPPPPLPRGDRVTRWAWAALLGSPLLLIAAGLVGLRIEGGAALLLVAAFIGGFVTLVARMKDRPGRDEDPDDGAVV